MNLKLAVSDKSVRIPEKRNEDAGLDIFAHFPEHELVIPPLETKLIPTGLFSSFSEDYRIIFKERGSTGSKGLKVSAGIIDSGYRGEWFVAITNCNNHAYIITKDKDKLNDKFRHFYSYDKAICQALIEKNPKVSIKIYPKEELLKDLSLRGKGKLGSTNKHE